MLRGRVRGMIWSAGEAHGPPAAILGAAFAVYLAVHDGPHWGHCPKDCPSDGQRTASGEGDKSPERFGWRGFAPVRPECQPPTGAAVSGREGADTPEIVGTERKPAVPPV